MKNLKLLGLDNNKLKNLPEEITKLFKLKTLLLDWNSQLWDLSNKNLYYNDITTHWWKVIDKNNDWKNDTYL